MTELDTHGDKAAAVDQVFSKMLAGGNGHDPGDSTAQAGTSARYVLRTASDALQPQPPIDWIIENLFSAGSVSLLVGEGGSKKTWAMLDAAVCVALGRPWLEFETKQAGVLFIDEESGARRMARRLGDVLRGYGADDTTPIWYVCLAGFNFLQGTDDFNELQKLIVGSGARLVIIDALADVMLGGDENSVKDIQPVFHGLRQVAEAAQVAVVVIHHANKAGSYRGSTAMHGAVDLLLKVESRTGESYIAFDCEKARDVEPHKFAAKANFLDRMFNLSVASPPARGESYSKAERYVLRYLEEHGESLIEDIKAHADACSENAARQAVYSLADKRKIERKNTGGQGAKAIFGLIDQLDDDD